VFDLSNTKSRSSRCHRVWHEPCSNWMRREFTGAQFTLKLARSGTTSVVDARFKSPLAHVSDWPRSRTRGFVRCGTADFSRRTPQMFGCRRCCGVFLLVDERCASQSPKSRRVRRAINRRAC
jgi:hypothetical protein